MAHTSYAKQTPHKINKCNLTFFLELLLNSILTQSKSLPSRKQTTKNVDKCEQECEQRKMSTYTLLEKMQIDVDTVDVKAELPQKS